MKTREYAPLDAVLARVSCLLILALLNACVTGGDNPPVAGSGGTLGASQSIVGMAVYVPKQDLGSPIAAGRGKQVFANLEGDGCVVQDPLAGVSDGRVHTWTSTKAYYGYLKTDTSLDASLTNAAVLSTSLDVVSRRATDRSTEIAGSVYEFNAYKQLFSLASECEDGRQNKGELDNDLTTTFNALPYPVERPDQTRSWDPYRRFLIDFGSHYVSQVKAGARYRSYSFKKSVTDVKESDLTIAACVSAQGVPTETGEVSVKGCENIDKKEAESIKLMDYTSTATAFGGKQDIRERLAAGETVSPELLSQFAATDGAAQDGVQYSLEPIWDLLASRAETDKQRNQARALQAYFEGFFAFNCDQVHGCGCSSVMDSKGKVLLRRFVQSDINYAQFRCERPAKGCRKDSDCNYKYGITVGNYCQCYGDHCVKWDDDSATVNRTGIDGKNTGPNRSCHYKLGSGCQCTRPAKNELWDAIWTSSE